MVAADLAGIFFRWVHIVSAIVLLGGVIFVRILRQPSLMAPFRGAAIVSIGAILASGVYNLLHKASTPPPYHMIFGVKFLLALHVFAVALIITKQGTPDSKRHRLLGGVVGSGLAITLLSAYLRWLSR